jgi:hypothetical protein
VQHPPDGRSIGLGAIEQSDAALVECEARDIGAGKAELPEAPISQCPIHLKLAHHREMNGRSGGHKAYVYEFPKMSHWLSASR